MVKYTLTYWQITFEPGDQEFVILQEITSFSVVSIWNCTGKRHTCQFFHHVASYKLCLPKCWEQQPDQGCISFFLSPSLLWELTLCLELCTDPVSFMTAVLKICKQVLWKPSILCESQTHRNLCLWSTQILKEWKLLLPKQRPKED